MSQDVAFCRADIFEYHTSVSIEYHTSVILNFFDVFLPLLIPELFIPQLSCKVR